MDPKIRFGEFSIPVPPSWRVSEQDGVLELAPPSPDGAAHFSLLKRSVSGLPTSRDARALIGNFALHQQLRVVGDIAFIESPAGVRATALLERIPPEPTEPRYWQLLVLICEHVALRATFCGDEPTSASFATARQLLQQVGPVEDLSV